MKEFVKYNSVLVDNYLYNLFFKKHQLLHLCHTYCKVPYEMHSGKIIQQLIKVNGFEYSEHSY